MRDPGAVEVGLNLVEEGIHPRGLEEILDVFGVAIELVEGGGGDGGLAGFTGLAWGGILTGGRGDGLRMRMRRRQERRDLDRTVDGSGSTAGSLFLRSHDCLLGLGETIAVDTSRREGGNKA